MNEEKIILDKEDEVAPLVDEELGATSDIEEPYDAVSDGEEDSGYPAEVGAQDEDAERRDYAELVREDINTLREKFTECASGLLGISDLKNPHRFAALRDLGLSAEEAYLATGGLKTSYDNRAHLGGTVPARTRGSLEIPRGEYEIARELFSDMSDADIKRLYRKVTK